ncbi:MAG: DUF4421 family protein [Chitinophagales bacterium]
MKKILAIVCIIFTCSSFGQKNSDVDEDYIELFPHHISLTQSIFRKDIGISIKEKKYPRLGYTINSRMKLGYHIAWKFISFGFAVNIPIGGNEEKYGQTNTFDFRTNFFIKNKILGDFYLVQSNGMHLSNPTQHIPEFKRTDNYPQFSNMKATQIGLDVLYMFNGSEYSYKAAFGQNAHQLKSAGSLLVGGYLYFIGVDNDGLLYPLADTSSFVQLTDLKGFNITTFGAAAGYAQNFVVKEHGLIGMMGLIGTGLSSFTEKTLTGETNDHNNFSTRIKLKGVLGYQGDVHNAGAQLQVNALLTTFAEGVRGSSILGYTGIYYKVQFPTKKYRN